jgi:hypothetical protein
MTDRAEKKKAKNPEADERQFELPLGDSLLNPKIGFGIVR